MHPVEVFCDGPGLVRLDGADEMPGQRQVGQLGLLVQRLLQIVLAEIALAGGECLANGSGWLGLADGQQAHRGGLTTHSLRRLTDACSDLCNILLYRGHYLRPPPWGLRGILPARL